MIFFFAVCPTHTVARFIFLGLLFLCFVMSDCMFYFGDTHLLWSLGIVELAT